MQYFSFPLFFFFFLQLESILPLCSPRCHPGRHPARPSSTELLAGVLQPVLLHFSCTFSFLQLEFWNFWHQQGARWSSTSWLFICLAICLRERGAGGVSAEICRLKARRNQQDLDQLHNKYHSRPGSSSHSESFITHCISPNQWSFWLLFFYFFFQWHLLKVYCENTYRERTVKVWKS